MSGAACNRVLRPFLRRGTGGWLRAGSVSRQPRCCPFCLSRPITKVTQNALKDTYEPMSSLVADGTSDDGSGATAMKMPDGRASQPVPGPLKGPAP
jgi:hypothetical protein